MHCSALINRKNMFARRTSALPATASAMPALHRPISRFSCVSSVMMRSLLVTLMAPTKLHRNWKVARRSGVTPSPPLLASVAALAAASTVAKNLHALFACLAQAL